MSGRYRIAFLMQQVLGHATYSKGLEAAVAADPDVDATWTPVTYWHEGGLIERVNVVPRGARGVARAALTVQRTLARHAYDAILFNTPALATSAARWMARTPTVIALDVTPRQYDVERAHFGHKARANGGASWKHAWNRHVFGRAAAFAPWSTWTARSLEADYAVDRAKIHVNPPGVDLDDWRPRHDAPRWLPRVLFVGGNFKRKGGDVLVDWFLRHGRGRCELDIVSGDLATSGHDTTDLRVHRNLRPNDPELRDLYRSSDLFVLPSRSEPFGIACVEALASGLPVIATRVGGITDIVDDGITGLLVPPDEPRALAEALDSLLDSDPRRAAMGAHARRVAAERFDARRNYGRLLTLLKAHADARSAQKATGATRVVAR